MKLLIPLILLLVLTGCSTHSVKLGKKCTKLAVHFLPSLTECVEHPVKTNSNIRGIKSFISNK